MQRKCDYYKKDEGGCRKRARVEIIYRCPNAKGVAALPSSVYRCWEHYLDLENTARHPGADFQVMKAILLTN